MSINPIISVIVPIYKVEKYLTRCIDSILAQTFTDFECILINDGSPDNSPKICDEYANKDERIKVIHKENGGVSSARNKGLDVAKGEWIAFVDSDDWVDEKYLKLMYDNAINNDVAVSICGVYIYENGIARPKDCKNRNMILTSEEAIIIMFTNRKFSIEGYAVNKLFKRQLIENGLRFDETIKYMEDSLFFYYLFKSVKKIFYSSKSVYFYRRIENSVTKQVGFTPAVNTAIDVFDKIYRNETNVKIMKSIYLEKIYFIYAKCVICIVKNKKNELFWSNIYFLKKSLMSRNNLPLVLNSKLFILLYFYWMIIFYKKLISLINSLYYCIQIHVLKS